MVDNDRRGASPSPATLAPDDITTRAFSTTFRGLSETEVRSFLARVADELSRAQVRMRELEAELEARRSTPDDVAPLDEGALLEALGEETTKLLRNAREAAKDIRARAEETAVRLRNDAQEEADRVRAEASELLDARTREADAAAAESLARGEAGLAERRREADEQIQTELDEAKVRGRAMVDEARAVRERMLADLGHRRALLQAQVAELRSGRDHLLEAYRAVKRSFLEATDALASIETRFAQSRPRPLDEAEIEAALRPDAGESASVELAESLEPEREAEPHAHADGEPGAEPAGAAGPNAEAPDSGQPDSGEAVGDLFARIRAEASESPDPAETPGTTDSTGTTDNTESTSAAADAGTSDAVVESAAGADGGEAASDADAQEAAATEEHAARPDPRERAATALAPVLVTAAKRAKRALQDEQNSVLDALRRHKGAPRAGTVLPTPDEQIAAWKVVIGDALARAYLAGHRDTTPDVSVEVQVPADLAEANVALLLVTLRERLVAALADHDGEGAADRVSARYREWKSQDLEPRLEDAVRGAYARGVYDATPEGAELRWVLAQPRCCADCADNVLEPVTKGSEFPTGQFHPPAHAGCRCLVEPS
jgi:DivIVA domain-containing protein